MLSLTFVVFFFVLALWNGSSLYYIYVCIFLIQWKTKPIRLKSITISCKLMKYPKRREVKKKNNLNSKTFNQNKIGRNFFFLRNYRDSRMQLKHFLHKAWLVYSLYVACNGIAIACLNEQQQNIMILRIVASICLFRSNITSNI